MKIIKTISAMRAALRDTGGHGQRVGFVPTMGALHEGHLDLVRRCRGQNELTVASIFVNPIQFNNPSDLEEYPRTLEADNRLLEAKGCDFVFAPSVDEMYPEPVRESYDFGLLDKVMEGHHRPGHFHGVAVVVRRLFDIVRPDRAYFGEKDYQQLQVVKALVRNLSLPVEIIGCPTIREADGLAMSSRNRRLTPAQRSAAPLIFQALRGIRERGRKVPVKETLAMATEMIESHGLLSVEYLELADASTLESITAWEKDRSVISCAAVYAGEVRLIDNLMIIS